MRTTRFSAGIFCLAIFAIAGCSKTSDNPAATPAESTAAAQQPTKIERTPIPINSFQQGFMDIIASYNTKYRNTESPLKRSALVSERFVQFEKLKGDPKKIKDWVGTIEHLITTGDGNAAISIALSENLTITTQFADWLDHQDHTLIPQTSPIYTKLADMKEGDMVRFSGRLKHAMDATEAGRMVDPNFLFVFSDITKIADASR